ncbi:MAG: CDP-alcohol phosphatidyltransferase family protein [Patescibacteria group bacterium]
MIITFANAITAFRLGLFAWFIVLVDEERLPLAAGIFFITWALDAVDGWLARHFHQASELGSLFDKVSDRVMMLGTIFTLLAYGVGGAATALLLAKDAGVLVALAAQPPERRQIDLGVLGKMATFLQGAALLWVMLSWPYELAVILIAAGFGAGVALRKLW